MSAIVQFCPPFSEADAARRLGVSVDTVRRERKRKNIGFIMIGAEPVNDFETPTVSIY